MVVGNHLGQKWSEAEIAIGQIMCDGQKQLCVKFFVLPNAIEAET